MTDFIRNDDIGKLILRLTLGVLMLFHGVSKFQNPGTVWLETRATGFLSIWCCGYRISG